MFSSNIKLGYENRLIICYWRDNLKINKSTFQFQYMKDQSKSFTDSLKFPIHNNQNIVHNN